MSMRFDSIEFDIKTMVTGVPDAFKTVSHINPALSAVKMIAAVAEIIPIRAIDPICYNLDALLRLVVTVQKFRIFGYFMQNIRNFMPIIVNLIDSLV